MFRRQLLGAAALSAAALAGCTAPSGTSETPAEATDSSATPPETPSPGPVTADPDDPIEFVVDNDTDSQQRVEVTLTGDDRTLIDESLTLDAGESRTFDPGIETTGEYDIAVAVADGPTRSMTLAIEAFDLRQGSNHFIDITDEDIRIYWEE